MLLQFRRCASTKITPKTIDIALCDGRKLTCKTGQFARLADGSSLLQAGDTAVLATVVGKTIPPTVPSKGFVSLTVEYRQRAAAAGRIPMNFLRREMAPSEREILSARLVDRAVRPLFSAGCPVETQVVCTLLSADSENEADVLAVNAASLALAVSDIPWSSPHSVVGAVRVGCINGQFVVNPTRSELQTSTLNLLVATNCSGNIVMLEGSASEIKFSDFVSALDYGSKQSSKVAKAILEMRSSVGKPKRTIIAAPQPDKQLLDSIYSLSSIKLKEIFSDATHDKLSRDMAVNNLREQVLTNMTSMSPGQTSSTPNNASSLADAFSQSVKRVFRRQILDKSLRCDGRGLDDLRPISCDVDLFAPLHGSAVFQRGQSQVFATVTFDSQEAAFRPDPAAALLMGLREKNFMLHYEFPAFATSELGRPGAVSRREIGHGALAERSLRPVMPENYPFTVRVTAEVLESNGSTSMAAVCSGSLALMDAGVPLISAGRGVPGHAAGVAIGLITDDEAGQKKQVLLTDQVGIEDYMGDMDFKIAGTLQGLTGLQADTKLFDGLPLSIAAEAVRRGASAIERTIAVMAKTLPKPRADRKPWAPVSEKFNIPASRRSQVIGLGGSNLRRLCSETGITMTPLDDSTYEVFAPNPRCMAEAKEKFAALLSSAEAVANSAAGDHQLEFGGVYRVRILELREFGVLVEFPKTVAPNLGPVLVHNSQLDSRRIAHPSALGLAVGQEISVKFFGRDPATGNIRLSRKVLFVGSSPSSS